MFSVSMFDGERGCRIHLRVFEVTTDKPLGIRTRVNISVRKAEINEAIAFRYSLLTSNLTRDYSDVSL